MALVFLVKLIRLRPRFVSLFVFLSDALFRALLLNRSANFEVKSEVKIVFFSGGFRNGSECEDG